MEEKLTKELADRLIKKKGETRGFNLLHDKQWILENKGGKGLLKVEKKIKDIGHPFKYREVKKMGFYPAGLRIISLLAIEDVFGLEREELSGVCALHPRNSIVIKLFVKYFYSISETLKKAPEMWRRYWTAGELVVVSHDPKKRKLVLRIEDFDLHPSFCACMEGYLKTVAEMVTGSKQVVCRETKCSFKKGQGHEYEINY